MSSCSYLVTSWYMKLLLLIDIILRHTTDQELRRISPSIIFAPPSTVDEPQNTSTLFFLPGTKSCLQLLLTTRCGHFLSCCFDDKAWKVGYRGKKVSSHMFLKFADSMAESCHVHASYLHLQDATSDLFCIR